MYGLSGEAPWKNSLRLGGALRRSDLHKLKEDAVLNREQQFCISWIKDNCQFHLTAHERAGTIHYRLFYHRGLNATIELETSENDLTALHSLIEIKTTEIACTEQPGCTPGRTSQMLAPAPLEELQSAFNIKTTDEQWIAALADEEQPDATQGGDSALMAQALCRDSWSYATTLAELFNKRSPEEGAKITMLDLGDVEENVGTYPERARLLYSHWRASTTYWS